MCFPSTTLHFLFPPINGFPFGLIRLLQVSYPLCQLGMWVYNGHFFYLHVRFWAVGELEILIRPHPVSDCEP